MKKGLHWEIMGSEQEMIVDWYRLVLCNETTHMQTVTLENGHGLASMESQKMKPT